jgi:hypothetical protein
LFKEDDLEVDEGVEEDDRTMKTMIINKEVGIIMLLQRRSNRCDTIDEGRMLMMK